MNIKPDPGGLRFCCVLHGESNKGQASPRTTIHRASQPKVWTQRQVRGPRELSAHRGIGIAADQVESKVSGTAGGAGGGWGGLRAGSVDQQCKPNETKPNSIPRKSNNTPTHSYTPRRVKSSQFPHVTHIQGCALVTHIQGRNIVTEQHVTAPT